MLDRFLELSEWGKGSPTSLMTFTSIYFTRTFFFRSTVHWSSMPSILVTSGSMDDMYSVSMVFCSLWNDLWPSLRYDLWPSLWNDLWPSGFPKWLLFLDWNRGGGILCCSSSKKTNTSKYRCIFFKKNSYLWYSTSTQNLSIDVVHVCIY